MTVPEMDISTKSLKCKSTLPTFQVASESAFSLDGYLRPFGETLRSRYEYFDSLLSKIEKETPGGLEEFSRGYERMGFVIDANGITYREWAPGAQSAFLIGDFSIKSSITYVLYYLFRRLES